MESSPRKIFHLVWPYRRRLYLALASAVVMTVLSLIPPLIVRSVVDRVIGEGHYEALEVLLLAALLVPTVIALIRCLNTFLISYVSQRVVLDLRFGLDVRLHGDQRLHVR